MPVSPQGRADAALVEAGKPTWSVTSQRVKAIQGGKPIFYLNASFQVEAEGFEHQAQMPVGITPPELLKSELELVRPYEQLIPATLKPELCELIVTGSNEIGEAGKG